MLVLNVFFIVYCFDVMILKSLPFIPAGALVTIGAPLATSTLNADKKKISVGVIGKSSVINTLISKKSCKVAPIPGETKIWQYITLFRNIYLTAKVWGRDVDYVWGIVGKDCN